ncbi:hypothetical protein [Streptomyces sp. H27-D2]|uniref:hypothetical protein n=1 Tax=Streptomyces sp. H27-D2 TaxID=3046304 RepID=UPI002DBDB46A|nr:hypothetical protein [Streptomyces sp. H27-D2]MEC4016679.1 hypothetical protein [Streptomyces sp. H27-D2]
MQTLAAPDLPHTRTRSVHWIATAAALAAIVAGAALVQPPGATATTRTSSAAGAAPRPGAAPDPGQADYPVKCGRAAVDVTDRASGDLDGDGRPETVAVVRCHAAAGSPPSGVYVLARPPVRAAKPRVLETLLDPKERLSVQDFAVRDGTVTARLLGYSSSEVPRCCPDRERSVKWRWKGGKFVLQALPVAGSV